MRCILLTIECFHTMSLKCNTCFYFHFILSYGFDSDERKSSETEFS